MRDLIDRTALLDYMQRVLNHMRDDMLAAGNDAYLRGYASALHEVEMAARVNAAPELLSIVKQFVALPSGAWHPERHAAEEAELMQEARAVLAKAEAAE
jgi:hypothetical protein